MAKKPPRVGKLNDEQRRYVIMRLAHGATPAEILIGLREEAPDTDITLGNIDRYDASKHGRKLAKRWIDLFWHCRKQLVEHLEDQVPEANKAIRVKILAEMSREFRRRNNLLAAADMLEKVAKEMGDVHTNRRELSGPKGKAIEITDPRDMSDEALNAELRQLLGHVLPTTSVAKH